jgi:hypothetical protein
VQLRIHIQDMQGATFDQHRSRKQRHVESTLERIDFLKSPHFQSYLPDTSTRIGKILSFDFQENFRQWVLELLPKKPSMDVKVKSVSPCYVNPYERLYREELKVCSEFQHFASLLQRLETITRAEENAVKEEDEEKDVDMGDVADDDDSYDDDMDDDTDTCKEEVKEEDADGMEVHGLAPAEGIEDAASHVDIEELGKEFWGGSDEKARGVEEFWNFSAREQL